MKLDNQAPVRPLSRLGKQVLHWPRNDTTRSHYRPWWMILWAAPFIFTCITLVYATATLCAFLSLFFQPSRASEVFHHIRNV